MPKNQPFTSIRRRSGRLLSLMVALAAMLVFAAPGTPGARAMSGSTTDTAMTASVARITYDGSMICTGTVVASGWIVTAYHCLFNEGPNGQVTRQERDKSKLKVSLWTKGVGVAGSTQVSMSVASTHHMDNANVWNGALGKYDVRDIALLKVNSMPSWAKPVAVATQWPAIGTTLTEYGYGRTSMNGPNATTLQKSQQGDISRMSCPTYPTNRTAPASPLSGTFCTTAKKSFPWSGDSGGPLLWWSNNKWQLVGVFNMFAREDPASSQRARWRSFWATEDGTTRSWIFNTISANTPKPPSSPPPVAPAPPANYGPPGTILISPCLDFHTAPGHLAPVVGCIPKNTVVKIQCVAYSNSVSGPYGSTNIWDRVYWGGRVGFVTDAYVFTNSDGPVAGSC